MNAHGSRCFHDAIANQVPWDIDAGIADPGLAMAHPLDAIEACKGPRLHIFRDDWQTALQDWLDHRIDPAILAEWAENLELYQSTLGTISVPVEQLDDDSAVGDLIELCTQKPASREIIQIFQGLKIEQNLEKYRSGFANSPLALRA